MINKNRGHFFVQVNVLDVFVRRGVQKYSVVARIGVERCCHCVGIPRLVKLAVVLVILFCECDGAFVISFVVCVMYIIYGIVEVFMSVYFPVVLYVGVAVGGGVESYPDREGVYSYGLSRFVHC